MSLLIPNYINKIKNAKPTMARPKGKLARAGKAAPFFVPPCNTNIILSRLPKEKIARKKLAKAVPIPPP